eukprot:6044510-Karenia_brevis.AAC.1
MRKYHVEDVVSWPQNYNNLTTSTTTDNDFYCPQGHHRYASQPLFSVVRPSKAVWCPSCRFSWGGTKWTCTCGISWHSCIIHYNSLPVLPIVKRKPRSTPNAATIEESAAKKAKLEPAKPATGRLAFKLTGKLASKFAHLQAQPCPHSAFPASICTRPVRHPLGVDTSTTTDNNAGRPQPQLPNTQLDSSTTNFTVMSSATSP